MINQYRLVTKNDTLREDPLTRTQHVNASGVTAQLKPTSIQVEEMPFEEQILLLEKQNRSTYIGPPIVGMEDSYWYKRGFYPICHDDDWANIMKMKQIARDRPAVFLHKKRTIIESKYPRYLAGIEIDPEDIQPRKVRNKSRKEKSFKTKFKPSDMEEQDVMWHHYMDMESSDDDEAGLNPNLNRAAKQFEPYRGPRPIAKKVKRPTLYRKRMDMKAGRKAEAIEDLRIQAEYEAELEEAIIPGAHFCPPLSDWIPPPPPPNTPEPKILPSGRRAKYSGDTWLPPWCEPKGTKDKFWDEPIIVPPIIEAISSEPVDMDKQQRGMDKDERIKDRFRNRATPDPWSAPPDGEPVLTPFQEQLFNMDFRWKRDEIVPDEHKSMFFGSFNTNWLGMKHQFHLKNRLTFVSCKPLVDPKFMQDVRCDAQRGGEMLHQDPLMIVVHWSCKLYKKAQFKKIWQFANDMCISNDLASDEWVSTIVDEDYAIPYEVLSQLCAQNIMNPLYDQNTIRDRIANFIRGYSSTNVCKDDVVFDQVVIRAAKVAELLSEYWKVTHPEWDFAGVVSTASLKGVAQPTLKLSPTAPLDLGIGSPRFHSMINVQLRKTSKLRLLRKVTYCADQLSQLAAECTVEMQPYVTPIQVTLEHCWQEFANVLPSRPQSLTLARLKSFVDLSFDEFSERLTRYLPWQTLLVKLGYPPLIIPNGAEVSFCELIGTTTLMGQIGSSVACMVLMVFVKMNPILALSMLGLLILVVMSIRHLPARFFG
jgi:hypothetical protein